MKLLHSILGLAAAATVALSGSANAQFDSENVDLHAWIDLGTFGSSSGNDCWGYVSPSGREYALMGLNNKVAFVEISNPRSPEWFASVNHNSSTWCDLKVFQHYAYIVTEGGSGIQIVDMSDIDNHQVTLVRTIGSPSSNHNVAINTDSGYLYTCGSSGGAARMTFWNLNNDPTNPTQVGTWDTYEHDAQIISYTSGPYAGREILYGASEGRGVDVLDVTNKSNPVLLARVPYANVAYCHQVWTEDLQYLYVNDELDSINRTSVFDISDPANPVFVRDFSSGSATDHNEYIKDGFLFEADYRSGVRIFDLNQNATNPPQVGYFDTYPGGDGSGFDGAWSCFPYFPSGTLIVSDVSSGLYILDPSAAITGSLAFSYPDGRPDILNPAGGTSMLVQVAATSNDVEPQPGTGLLHVDVGSGFVELPMTDLGGNLYQAVFPSTPCGSLIQYYVSAESTVGQLYTDPSSAPSTSYSALSAAGFDLAFEDDFESNQGWTVENVDLQAGAWERGVPAGDGDRGDPTSDFDGSGQCYLTENAAGNSDVDGGPTRLISPTLDLSNGDYTVSYARWFTNDDGDGDRLEVHISNNNGGSWTLVESVPGGSGWQQHSFNVSDFVAPTATVRVRFSATDNPNDSVTEAAIDAFEVSQVLCDVTELTGFDVVVGTLTSGGLDELRSSDDAYLRTRSGFGPNLAELHKLEMNVTAGTAVANPVSVDVSMETRIGHPSGTGQLLVRNWNTNAMDFIGTFPLNDTDATADFTGLDATKYVNGGGEIEIKVKHLVFLPQFAFQFDSFIDLIEVTVN